MCDSCVIRTYVEAKSNDIGPFLLRNILNEGAV